MNYRFNVKVERIVVNKLAEIIFMDVIDEPEIDEIFPFVIRSQLIDYDNVVDAFLIKLPDKSAADKSGASCYDNHLLCSLCFLDSPVKPGNDKILYK
jgi:hypothetical protein